MNELYHYGIKGMKWGVRRSRVRRAKSGEKPKRDDWSDDAKTVANLRKKSVNQMSNAELRKVNERVQLESTYRNLNKSKSFVKDVGSQSMKEVTKSFASKAITAAISTAVIGGVTVYAKGGLNANEAKIADFIVDVFKKK